MRATIGAAVARLGARHVWQGLGKRRRTARLPFGGAVRNSSSGAPPPEKDEVLRVLAQLEQNQAGISAHTVAALSNQTRQKLAAALTALNVITPNKDPAAVTQLFQEADVNKDGQISVREFSSFLSKYDVRKRHGTTANRADVDTAAVAAAAAAAGAEVAVLPPTKLQLYRLFMRGMVPMIGFGFVDNFVMLTAGDAVDMTLGNTLRISTLAAAGLGNMVSDIAGLMLNHGIEGAASKIGLKSPNLSTAQMALPICRKTLALASIVGISIGCLLGMVPLLFMDTERRELRVLFQDLEPTEDNTVPTAAMVHAASLFDVGKVTKEDIDDAVKRVLKEPKERVHFEEFVLVMKYLKQKTRPWWMFW